MSDSPSTHEQFENLVRHMDPRASLRRAWPLEGGVSAEVTALEVQHADGHIEKVVVRRHGPRDLQANPHVAANEFKLLEFLHGKGLAVPAPRHVDESGKVLASPFVVVDFVDGENEWASSDQPEGIQQMAAFLAALHQTDVDPSLSFLPHPETYVARHLAKPLANLDETLSESVIRERLEPIWPPPKRNQPAVLHGDFWPGNIRWQGSRLAAVIDWEDAASGDPLADLANTRLELLWAFDEDTMVNFTNAYTALTSIDSTSLPYWDLWAALRPAGKLDDWGLDETEKHDMREKHGLFVSRALDAIGAR